MMWDLTWGWGMGLGLFFMILFWGAIIALIVWLIIKLTKREGGSGKDKSIEIARERYAKGEISKEEFEQIKKDIS
jgi:putative membrane protein